MHRAIPVVPHSLQVLDCLFGVRGGLEPNVHVRLISGHSEQRQIIAIVVNQQHVQ
jgi:hypothetical protein